MQRVRTLLKYAWEEALVDKPVRVGTTFKKPSKKIMRQARHEAGSRMLEAAELRSLIAAAGVPVKAMILLGLNCGFGQSDVSSLPVAALDLKQGWLDFPRPKTGVPRRCPLWPETANELRAALASRPAPKEPKDDGLFGRVSKKNNGISSNKSDMEPWD